ncbi:rfbP protein [Vibrio cholerae]|nr:rfbP protein [Vibrio cholerae]QJS90079.1 rfbP protein [Vibrio cholerae O1 biovar El Tor]QJS93686.1 rfbP protein [Vibrio cholerae C6706]MBW3673050.1 rfbP protein [Vibrio cholerae]MBW3677009.1 rfbP protein [Vibrio cholerae]
MKTGSHLLPVFIVIPKPPLLAVVIVPRGFCPKMRPC